MSGLWLKNGMHFNITYEYAMKIADELDKNGCAFFGDDEVKMVLPVKEGPGRKTNNSKTKLRPIKQTFKFGKDQWKSRLK